MPLGGHLGADVSALVDDQLPADEAERGWRHVEGCTWCRGAVQQELWVKDRLHTAPAPTSAWLPDPALTAVLAGLGDKDVPARPRPRRGSRRGGGALPGGEEWAGDLLRPGP